MIWLVGRAGMLGREVERLLERDGRPYLASDREVDITDPAALREFLLRRDGVRWILNCSAYTAVDRAEEEPEAAFRINADGPENLARLAREIGARLVHISTDYVFSGAKSEPYTEEDETGPLGVYGLSKLAGEERIRAVGGEWFIVRTAWLYGRHGGNFVHTMLRLFRERDTLRVVADQWGNPTWARHLAGFLLHLVERGAPAGEVYHYTSEGRASWHEFAGEIHRLALERGLLERPVRLLPISTAEYAARAPRPANSCLSKEKVRRTFGLAIPHWREALQRYFQEELERTP
jgi:dTDP-4-dehydrorhamnose reductase